MNVFAFVLHVVLGIVGQMCFLVGEFVFVTGGCRCT